MAEYDRVFLSEIPVFGFKAVVLPYSGEERKEEKTDRKKAKNMAFSFFSTARASPLYRPILYAVISGVLFRLFFIAMFVCFILSSTGKNRLPSSDIYFAMFLLSSILFGSSLLIFFIGILGNYLPNILLNTRRRPSYILENIQSKEKKQ